MLMTSNRVPKFLMGFFVFLASHSSMAHEDSNTSAALKTVLNSLSCELAPGKLVLRLIGDEKLDREPITILSGHFSAQAMRTCAAIVNFARSAESTLTTDSNRNLICSAETVIVRRQSEWSFYGSDVPLSRVWVHLGNGSFDSRTLESTFDERTAHLAHAVCTTTTAAMNSIINNHRP